MKVHKHVLLRLPGLNFSKVSEQHLKLSVIAFELDLQKLSLKNDTDELLAMLHDFNQSVEDQIIQNKVQNFRRLLFNGKVEKLKKNEIESCIPDFLALNIRDLLARQADFKDLNKRFDHQYHLLLEMERLDLKRISQNDNFLKGLLVSSHSLLAAYSKYLEKNLESFNKKEIHTERAVLRYISRIYAKTSPFSSYTTLAIGKVKRTSSTQLLSVSSPDNFIRPNSKLQVNNVVQEILIDILTADILGIEMFSVKINSTLKDNGGNYTYISNNHNAESFHTISGNDTLAELLKCFAKRTECKITLLITVLSQKYDGELDFFKQYIFSLIKQGVFEIKLAKIRSSAVWMVNLKNNLDILIKRRPDVPHRFLKLADTLEALGKVIEDYPLLVLNERQLLLKKAHDQIKAAIDAFNIEGQMLSRKCDLMIAPEKLFFEDCTLSGSFSLNDNSVNKMGKIIYELNEQLDVWDINEVKQEQIANYFKLKYKDEREVHLLDFFEAYFKDVLVFEIKEKEEQGTPSETFLNVRESTKERGKALYNWKQKFLSYVSVNKDYMSFKADVVKNVNESLSIPPKKANRSVAAFVQPAFTKSGALKYFVMNSSYYGFGKMFSRFLPLFPGVITSELLLFNKKAQPDNALFAEVKDGSLHNANVHPQMLPYEINIPGNAIFSEIKGNLFFADMVIAFDSIAQRTKLIHKPTGNQIFIFDMGFQTPNVRSALYSFLNSYSYAGASSPVALCNAINQKIREQHIRGPLEFPRIVVDDLCVIQRKTWVMTAQHFCDRAPTDDDAAYFLKLLRWKRQYTLPDHVFVSLYVKVTNLSDAAILDRESQDYKPQYINLSSPLYSQLLESIFKKADPYIQVQEMLPENDELYEDKNGSYVSEFYFQVNHAE